MAEVTVKQLADVVGTPVDRLLAQIKEAGLSAESADAMISDTDKL
jgi:translation initiation factor IF-2